MERKKYLIITAAALASVVMLALVSVKDRPDGSGCPDFSQATAQVGEQEFMIGIAETALEQQKGLGGCRRLGDNQGLLFPYEEPSTPVFWMKGMLIPIDIIWIQDGAVLAVDRRVPPPGEAGEIITKQAPAPVTAVLEVAAGQADNLKKGDTVKIE